MKSRDPLERAQILARFDRTSEAIAVVRQALHAEPHRADLLRELAELETHRANLGGIGAVKHQLVGWSYLLASLGLVFLPVYALLASTRFDDVSPTGMQLLIGLGVLVLLLVVLIYIAIRVFLWLWFKRLARLPAPVRPFAEAALARAMALHAMEPQYSRVKKRLLSEPDA